MVGKRFGDSDIIFLRKLTRGGVKNLHCLIIISMCNKNGHYINGVIKI